MNQRTSEIESNPSHLYEPSIVRAALRYWFVVALSVLLFALAGIGIARTRSEQYEATAGLAVRDPGFSDLFGSTRTISPERYVIDQVEILRSDLVTDRARQIAAESEPPIVVSSREIRSLTRIDFDPDADFIKIAASTKSAANSQALADSVALAYQDVVQASADDTTQRLLSQLDNAIEEVEIELAALREQTTLLLEANPATARLNDQVNELADQLIILRGASARPDADDLNAIAFIKQELEARRLIQELQNSSPEISSLLRQQEESTSIRESLRLRRGEVAATAASSGSGVTLYSPAGLGQAIGIGLFLAVQAGAVLGLLAGAAISYFLALRKLEFSQQDQPQLVFNVPLMGVFPKLSGKATTLPSLDAPESPEAEAIRFVTAALAPDNARFARELASPTHGMGSVAFVSAESGEGKSTVLANVAIAAAYQRRSVLVIDADFGHQAVSQLLLPDQPATLGLTEAALESVPLDAASVHVPLPGASGLRLISRGLIPVSGPDFFYSAATQRFLREVVQHYDLVLIDTPAMMGVAYTGPIIQQVDRVIAVVKHRSSIVSATNMRHRLELNDVRLSGYVYNGGPSLSLKQGEGSMVDVLGIHGKNLRSIHPTSA